VDAPQPRRTRLCRQDQAQRLQEKRSSGTRIHRVTVSVRKASISWLLAAGIGAGESYRTAD